MPPAANEAGWKDTAQKFPVAVNRVMAKLDRLGEYARYYHVLLRKDHEMMRPYDVVL